MKLNITMVLRLHHSMKDTVIIKVHLVTKDPRIQQNYQNMFGSYKSKEKYGIFLKRNEKARPELCKLCLRCILGLRNLRSSKTVKTLQIVFVFLIVSFKTLFLL